MNTATYGKLVNDSPKAQPKSLFLNDRQFAELQRAIAEFDHEKMVRNRERDYAKSCGWEGEAYWETAPIADLEREQRQLYY